MKIDDINIPDTLMSKVEQNLRSHVKARKKRKSLYAAGAALALALIIPASVYAYTNYLSSIPYSQEINLARENNATTKLNAVFKYKNVEFKLKEAVADETGLVVLYDVSDPRYSINSIGITKSDGSKFSEWGLSLPQSSDKETEKAFYISLKGENIGYLKDNPVIIKMGGINNSSTNKDTNVDWSLKLQVPVQEVKSYAINKEQKLDIGTIKFKTLKISVLKTYLDYEFIPSDKSIHDFIPIFSFRIDNEYLDSVHDFPGGARFSNSDMEFRSVYYSNPKEIGIRLIGANVFYKLNNPEVFTVDKNKLPTTFAVNGEKITAASVKENGTEIEYTFLFDKENRSYSNIDINPVEFVSNVRGTGNSEIVKFKDQAHMDKLYESLASKIPNFKQIYTDSNLNAANTSMQIKFTGGTSNSFSISRVSKNLLFDLDEVVVKP